MRKLAPFLFLFLAFNAFAQEEHLEHLKMMMHEMSQHGPVVPQPEAIVGLANVAQTIQPHCSGNTFGFTPSQFTVHQGDVVTLTITVASNDCSSVGHGMLMDTYIESGVNVARGQTKNVTFTATTAGTFIWVCTQPSCGTGHSSMVGTMIVTAAPAGPTITSVAPNNGPIAGGTSVTISGTNFVSGATVVFGGTAATNVNVASATSITARTPAHADGTVDVTVTNPDGQVGTRSQGFTFNALKIQTVTPNTGPTTGGTNVTISGSSFQNGATVKFGGRDATNVTVTDSNTIIATTPLGPTGELLQVDVVVTNPDGTSVTLHPGFTYSVPPLQVTTINPTSIASTGGSVVTITGAGFTTAVNSSVTFGGVPGTNVTILDPVTLQVTAPAHAAGTVDVVVSVGALSVTKTGALTYTNPSGRRRLKRN